MFAWRIPLHSSSKSSGKYLRTASVLLLVLHLFIIIWRVRRTVRYVASRSYFGTPDYYAAASQDMSDSRLTLFYSFLSFSGVRSWISSLVTYFYTANGIVRLCVARHHRVDLYISSPVAMATCPPSLFIFSLFSTLNNSPSISLQHLI